MVADMMGTFKIIASMVKVSLHFKMVISIMGIGSMGRHMDKEYIIISMATSLKANLYLIFRKVSEKKLGVTAHNMSACSKME